MSEQDRPSFQPPQKPSGYDGAPLPPPPPGYQPGYPAAPVPPVSPAPQHSYPQPYLQSYPDPFGVPAYGQQPPQPPAGGYGYPAPGGYGYAHAAAPASWIKRVAAALVDGLLTVPFSIADGVFSAVVGPGSGAAVLFSLLMDLCALGVLIWNRYFRMGGTGYSLGKQTLGIRLVNEADGQPIGAGRAFLRDICHLADVFTFYLGYLWPLWDRKRQTFADKMMHTVVVEQPKN